MEKEFDLVIIGGGIAGYTAAIRASQLGMHVALIEKNKLGGTCLHQGCIPTKTYLKTSRMIDDMKHANVFGIDEVQPKFSFEKIQERKNNIVEQLYRGVEYLVQKNKIKVINGTARLLSPSIFSPRAGTVSVSYEDGSSELIQNKFVLICTGSRPKALSFLPFNHKNIISSDDFMKLEQLPKSIGIVGAGVIGIEFASFLADLNVKVTVLEAGDTILPNEDKAYTKHLQKALEARGVRFIFNCQLNEHDFDIDENVTLKLKNINETLTFEKMLIAIGRQPNSDDIGLENTKIETAKQMIVVNDQYQTSEAHIYAVGDVIGGLQLAHVAAKEAITAVEWMNDLVPLPILENQIPRCIYSNPEMASVGFSKESAKKLGYEIIEVKIPFKAIGMALIENNAEGFASMIFDKHTNDILGVSMIGKQATELINEVSLAKFMNASGYELGSSVHAHPSMSEILNEIGLASVDKAIHF